MDIANLTGLILVDASRIGIAEAVSTGAAWEIWMQVELAVLLRQRGLQAAREVPYPPPNAGLSLDILASDAAGQYAIELKVESATNAGAAILTAVQQDVAKIASYQFGGGAPSTGRWVVAIAYSAAARHAMSAHAAVPANHASYSENSGIGVMIVNC